MHLANAAIEIRNDRLGRECAYYYSRGAMRWMRMSLDEAKLILAGRGL